MSDDPRRVELREKRVEQLRDCWSRLVIEYDRSRRWRDRRAAAALATGLKIVDAFIRIEELTPLDGHEQEALATIRRVIRQSNIFENGLIEPFESDAEEGLPPAEAAEVEAVRDEPLVAAVLDKFPDAEIVNVRRRDEPMPEAPQ
jgi:hypothetical protein